jgi:hypothetical protein
MGQLDRITTVVEVVRNQPTAEIPDTTPQFKCSFVNSGMIEYHTI